MKDRGTTTPGGRGATGRDPSAHLARRWTGLRAALCVASLPGCLWGGAAGPAAGPEQPLSNTTYAVPWSGVRFDEPPGMAAVFRDLGMDGWLVVDVLDLERHAQTITLRVVSGERGAWTIEPDCDAITVLGPNDFSRRPAFVAGPGDLTIRYGGSAMLLVDLALYGDLVTSDPHGITDGRLDAMFDVRPLNAGGCAFVAFLADGECVPCRDGVAECIPVVGSFDAMPPTTLVDLDAACGVTLKDGSSGP